MLIVADTEKAFRERVIGHLARSADVIEVAQLRELAGVLAERGSEPSVILIGPHIKVKSALSFAMRSQQEAPDTSIVLVAATEDAEFLREALRAGVRDVLPNSFAPAQLKSAIVRAETLSRVARERAGAGAPVTIDATDAAPHRIVTVFSSKGGVGKSMVASNLAVLLAQRGNDVALVDLDLSSGDLGVMLKLFPQRTLADAVADLDRLDEEALRGYLEQHVSKVWLLGAPQEPGAAEQITAEDVQTVLRKLRDAYQYVVVDSPPMFNDHVLAAIDESDMLVAVTTMDVPSIKNIRLSLQTLEMLGVTRERLRLVLNRADSKVGLNIPEVEKTLNTKVDLAIPSSRDVPLSINRGVVIAADQPKSPVALALARLADSIAVGTGAQRKQGGHRFHVGRKR